VCVIAGKCPLDLSALPRRFGVVRRQPEAVTRGDACALDRLIDADVPVAYRRLPVPRRQVIRLTSTGTQGQLGGRRVVLPPGPGA
jgi:hypothetical protein